MKKIILTLLVASATFFSQAQNISTVFLDMPDEITLKIEKSQKEVLLEEVNDSVKALNVLNDTIERIGLSDSYIALRTSSIGTLQIKLLPTENDSFIIGVIHTVCGKACDSQIKFYTSSWELIKNKKIFPKKSENWFFKDSINRETLEFKNAQALLSMTPISLTFSATDPTISAFYNIKSYLAKEDYKQLQAFLITKFRTFKWERGAYTLN